MKKIFLVLGCLLISIQAISQELLQTSEDSNVVSEKSTETMMDQSSDLLDYQTKKNTIELNLTSLVFRNFQLQYERILSKRISVGLTLATIPTGGIPLSGTVENSLDGDQEIELLTNAEVGYFSFTPEVHIYFGKGYGKGFYIAPYFRNAKWTFANLEIEFDGENNSQESISVDGDIKSNSIGMLLGTQFNLGKNLVLDWWIVGGHYGSSKGTLRGNSTQSFSEIEQANLKQELDELDLPLVETTSEVTANSAKIIADGPWGGVRSGFTLGYRF